MERNGRNVYRFSNYFNNSCHISNNLDDYGYESEKKREKN